MASTENTQNNSPETEIVSARTGKAPLFEAQTCGRCGGSGHYSFNLMHGSTCYGCGGHGYKLTKRGAAAQEFFTDLLSKKVEDLEPGDKILNPGVPGIVGSGWVVVNTVEVKEQQVGRNGVQVTETVIVVDCDSVREGGMGYCLTEFPGKMHRVAADRETKQAAREQALAFQATLTKQGQPRKNQA